MGSWVTPHLRTDIDRKSLGFSFLLIVCLCCVSCGSDVQQPGTINNGNWLLTGKSTSDSSRMFYAAGPLVQTGLSVAGTVKIGNWAADFLGLNAGSTLDCLSTDDTVKLSGSFSGSKLVVTGVSNSGGSLSLKLEGTADKLTGTYTVQNTAACTGTGTVTAAMVQPVDGTWTGIVHYMDGVNSGVSVNVQITQGTFNSISGNAPITGSGTLFVTDPNNPLHVTPNPCVVDSSFVVGDRIAITCAPFAFQGVIADPATPAHLLGSTSWPLGTVLLTKSN